MLASTLIKAAWATERWVAGRWTAPRPPLTLVLSVGRPVKAMRLLGFVADNEVAGLHRARLGVLEALLVDVRNLARVPGTSFLRAFDHREALQGRNLLELYRDPEVSRTIRPASKEPS